MTVKVRPYKRGGWEVDIMLTIPDRPKVRERRRAPVSTKSAAKRWGQERERQLIHQIMSLDPPSDPPALPDEPPAPDEPQEVPTLARFIPRYLEEHCRANRLRPATIEQRQTIYRTHLIPAFGRKPLDQITAQDIQRFKADRAHLAPTTLNLMLTLLRCIFNVAVHWGVINTPPVRITKLREGPRPLKFYDFEELDRLVLAAERSDNPNHRLTVLLGGEAGLRSGEMRALRWSDVDLKRGTLTVSRSLWRNEEGPPKGGSARTIKLAPRLLQALVEQRPRRGPNVLWTRYGTVPGRSRPRHWLTKVQHAAGFSPCGPHILRHTFCSHLAMLGVPPRVIQALAGHQSITTTERYMHLAPHAMDDAVDRLARPSEWRHSGDGSDEPDSP